MIREGDSGSDLYVSSQGEYEVIKDGKVLGKLGTGKAFGELAILYNCKRTASIKGKVILKYLNLIGILMIYSIFLYDYSFTETPKKI